MYRIEPSEDYRYLAWLIANRGKKRARVVTMELVRMVYSAHMSGAIDGYDRDELLTMLCGGTPPWTRKDKQQWKP